MGDEASTPARPWVAVIGGMDPTGGAGVWRDVWTLRAFAPQLDVRVVVTALTRQGHGGPARARAVPLARFADQLDGLSSDPSPAAIKVGLVPESLAVVLAGWLGEGSSPVVVDPVLRASDGGSMGSTSAGYLKLAERAAATLWTPNGDEARVLLDGIGGPRPTVPQFAVRRLGAALGGAVLLKGGHGLDERGLDEAAVVDLLFAEGTVHRFARSRLGGPEIRGTGCALASAITGRLALGDALGDAVEAGGTWLATARQGARRHPSGRHHLS